jgi:hypothetical protein
VTIGSLVPFGIEVSSSYGRPDRAREDARSVRAEAGRSGSAVHPLPGAIVLAAWWNLIREEQPFQVVRRYYAAAAEGDCLTSLSTLSQDLRRSIDGRAYRRWLEGQRGTAMIGEQTLIGGGTDRVQVVRGPVRRRTALDRARRWSLERDGRTWPITAFPPRLATPFLRTPGPPG